MRAYITMDIQKLNIRILFTKFFLRGWDRHPSCKCQRSELAILLSREMQTVDVGSWWLMILATNFFTHSNCCAHWPRKFCWNSQAFPVLFQIQRRVKWKWGSRHILNFFKIKKRCMLWPPKLESPLSLSLSKKKLH